jgi:hypothetical protein
MAESVFVLNRFLPYWRVLEGAVQGKLILGCRGALTDRAQKLRAADESLANMRANDVYSVSAVCEICRHESVVNVDVELPAKARVSYQMQS